MRYLLIAYFALFAPVMALGDEIKGSACYRFSDQESISAARDIALSMAKRNALESYIVFVETSSIVENATLKNDLISSITAGLLKNIRISSESEDLNKREVCRQITADVEPLEIKQHTAATVSAFRREQGNTPTGLPENQVYRILKVARTSLSRNAHTVGYNGFDAYGFGDDNGYCEAGKDCILVYARCKSSTSFTSVDSEPGVMITWYDKDGIPDSILKGRRGCQSRGDIHKYYLQLPPAGYSWKLELISG
jgi:hypothetical protein